MYSVSRKSAPDLSIFWVRGVHTCTQLGSKAASSLMIFAMTLCTQLYSVSSKAFLRGHLSYHQENSFSTTIPRQWPQGVHVWKLLPRAEELGIWRWNGEDFSQHQKHHWRSLWGSRQIPRLCWRQICRRWEFTQDVAAEVERLKKHEDTRLDICP